MSDLKQTLPIWLRGLLLPYFYYFFDHLFKKWCISKPLLRYGIHTQVVLVVKNPSANVGDIRSLGGEDPLEEGTATPSSILAWRIPRTEEPGRL